MTTLRLSHLIMMIALVAVMARAIIPTGYMPETQNGKTFQLTICSMEGPKTVTVDEKFRPVPAKHSGSEQTTKETCTFGILAHAPFYAESFNIVFETPYQIIATQKIATRDQFVRKHVFYSVAQPRAPPTLI